MSITLGSIEITRLAGQPFGYESSRVYRGLTARRWDVSALLLPDEWDDLTGAYETWAALKASEGDPAETEVVGATLTFSCTGFGQSWTNIPVWFLTAPSAAQRGIYVLAQFSVVDAAQQLALLLAEADESESGSDDEIEYGTATVAGVTLRLLQNPDEYDNGPTASPTATGTDLIEGPLFAWRVRNLRGWTNSQVNWETIRDWYPGAAAVRPSSGQWFPVEAPTMTRDRKRVDGTMTDRWIVSVKLRRIR
jgi:hypothetical protein